MGGDISSQIVDLNTASFQSLKTDAFGCERAGGAPSGFTPFRSAPFVTTRTRRAQNLVRALAVTEPTASLAVDCARKPQAGGGRLAKRRVLD